MSAGLYPTTNVITEGALGLVSIELGGSQCSSALTNK